MSFKAFANIKLKGSFSIENIFNFLFIYFMYLDSIHFSVPSHPSSVPASLPHPNNTKRGKKLKVSSLKL